jgi:hypothetical protein
VATFAWGQDKPWKSVWNSSGLLGGLFCPCYFNQHAQDHHSGEHHCNFNNVPRVLSGNYGGVDLKGLKVWLNGDLGDDWATKGEADWLVVTFEPKTTKEQKDAMVALLGKIYPVKWRSFQPTPPAYDLVHLTRRQGAESWLTAKPR